MVRFGGRTLPMIRLDLRTFVFMRSMRHARAARDRSASAALACTQPCLVHLHLHCIAAGHPARACTSVQSAKLDAQVARAHSSERWCACTDCPCPCVIMYQSPIHLSKPRHHSVLTSTRAHRGNEVVRCQFLGQAR